MTTGSCRGTLRVPLLAACLGLVPLAATPAGAQTLADRHRPIPGRA